MDGGMFAIVNFPPGEYLLYSQVSGGKVYYIANIPRGDVYYIVNIPGEGLLYSKHSGGRFAMRKVYYTTPDLGQMRPWVS